MDFKETRKKLGLSQIEMAQHLKVHINTYTGWERNVSNPNAENKKRVELIIRKLVGDDK